jgi:hypothetical protein
MVRSAFAKWRCVAEGEWQSEAACRAEKFDWGSKIGSTLQPSKSIR